MTTPGRHLKSQVHVGRDDHFLVVLHRVGRIDPDKTTITMSANVPATGATDEDQDEPVTVTVRYDIAEVRAMFGAFGDFLPVAISSSATQKVE